MNRAVLNRNKKRSYLIPLIVGLIAFAGVYFLFFNKPDKKQFKSGANASPTATPKPTLTPTPSVKGTSTGSSATTKTTALNAVTDFANTAKENNVAMSAPKSIVNDGASAYEYVSSGDLNGASITFDTFSSVISKYKLKLNNSSSSDITKIYETSSLTCEISIDENSLEISCF